MCGIAGMLGQAIGSDTAPLRTLAHRGPDDSGWVAHRADSAHAPALLLHRGYPF